MYSYSYSNANRVGGISALYPISVKKSYKCNLLVIIRTDFEALQHLASPPDNCDSWPGSLRLQGQLDNKYTSTPCKRTLPDPRKAEREFWFCF